MGRWQNLGIIAAVIVVIAGVLYFRPSFPPPQQGASFDDGFSDLQSIMSARGITISNIDLENLDKIASLSAAEIANLKASISSLKNKYQNVAFASVADIYLDILGVIEVQRKLDNRNTENVTVGLLDPCAEIGRLKELSGLEAERIQKMETLFQEINEFVAAYPAESKVAGFEEIEINLETSKNDLEESNQYIQQLEGLCG